MAVYQDMDIGTAKPSLSQRESVPHHLIDVVPPTEEYSVSQFVVQAHETALDIRRRGKVPLLVGGTPLYLKSLFAECSSVLRRLGLSQASRRGCKAFRRGCLAQKIRAGRSTLRSQNTGQRCSPNDPCSGVARQLESR